MLNFHYSIIMKTYVYPLLQHLQKFDTQILIRCWDWWLLNGHLLYVSTPRAPVFNLLLQKLYRSQVLIIYGPNPDYGSGSMLDWRLAKIYHIPLQTILHATKSRIKILKIMKGSGRSSSQKRTVVWSANACAVANFNTRIHHSMNSKLDLETENDFETFQEEFNLLFYCWSFLISLL